ncbi:MAG TPA: molybdate ABC transporter substrate-binding protein [Candidatus Limnocylindrales bacterium]|nr:molybdate ABC transporter substrate-binding protein [Candidatus Limnocylindrales bacterium]
MTPRAALAIVVAAALAVACSSAGGAPPSAPDTGGGRAAPSDLTVFGAASLKDALDEAGAAYEAGHPGTTVTIATDSSAALAAQIEQGAPADVFLSADTTTSQRLLDGGVAVGDAVLFAANELTVIVPTDNPAGIAAPADLAKPGVKIIAAGDEVPITRYAAQLVENLAREPGAPAGLAAMYAANVVSKEDNVKAVVAKIELGEGDAGIVYATDAAASDAVRTVDVPDAASVRAAYAGVVIQASPNQAAAAAFLEWLAGAAGRNIMAGFGFLPPAS